MCVQGEGLTIVHKSGKLHTDIQMEFFYWVSPY